MLRRWVRGGFTGLLAASATCGACAPETSRHAGRRYELPASVGGSGGKTISDGSSEEPAGGAGAGGSETGPACAEPEPATGVSCIPEGTLDICTRSDGVECACVSFAWACDE